MLHYEVEAFRAQKILHAKFGQSLQLKWTLNVCYFTKKDSIWIDGFVSVLQRELLLDRLQFVASSTSDFFGLVLVLSGGISQHHRQEGVVLGGVWHVSGSVSILLGSYYEG